MKLHSFKIENYKVIDETETIKVDPNVTALVGKNESGKTALQRAIWKSNNVAGEEFDKLLDYPRARYSRERRESQNVTTLGFVLAGDEREKLGKLLPADVEAPEIVEVVTGYDGEDDISVAVRFDEETDGALRKGPEDARRAIEAVARALASCTEAGDDTISVAEQTALAALDDRKREWVDPNKSAVETFVAEVDGWAGAAETRAQHAAKERAALAVVAKRCASGSPLAAARKWVQEQLPTFIYFDDYGQLETRIHLPTYLTQVKEEHVAPRVRTQRALFNLSGIDPDEILELGQPKQSDEEDEDVQRRLDKRRTILESASISLSGEWADWWLPGVKHKLHIAADGEYLVLNVSDSKSEHQIPFGERSAGFQWFFSFYLVFLVESEEAHSGAILLLDEPGLHLHATLQTKLIDFFDRVSERNQLIYSTHLPFLVDGERLDRVRTVFLSDEEPPKTVVSENVCGGGDRDTLFPLQAAIGYSIAQTLFFGQRSVIVEGVTDYWILKALVACLAARGSEPRLHPDTVLVPAGGTRSLMPLASIMFASTGVEGKRMAVLLDSDRDGVIAKGRLEARLFGGDSRLIMLGDVLGIEGAEVEDLAARDEYAAATARAFNCEVELDADEKAAATNVAAIQQHWKRTGRGEFGRDEKAATALALVSMWGDAPSSVEESTIERAGELFGRVNATFEK